MARLDLQRHRTIIHSIAWAPTTLQDLSDFLIIFKHTTYSHLDCLVLDFFGGKLRKSHPMGMLYVLFPSLMTALRLPSLPWDISFHSCFVPLHRSLESLSMPFHMQLECSSGRSRCCTSRAIRTDIKVPTDRFVLVHLKLGQTWDTWDKWFVAVQKTMYKFHTKAKVVHIEIHTHQTLCGDVM